MAGREIDHVAATITGATGSSVTMASTTGFYKNAVVWLAASGQTTIRCVITKVVSGTVLSVVRREIEAGSVPSYGGTDISAYNPGTITQLAQFVYNVNDLPLS